jgi:hypothetical protein
MTVTRFAATHAKMNAAVRHGDRLKEEIERYQREFPARLEAEQEGPDVSIYMIVPPPPEEVLTSVGDVVHQMRAALDSLACDLARLSDATSVKGVYFPIAQDETGFLDKKTQDKIKKLKPEFRRIIHDFKPYGSSPLAVLNMLANTDKHSGLIAAVPTLSDHVITTAGQQVTLDRRVVAPADGVRRAFLRIRNGAYAEINVQVSCELTFGVHPVSGNGIAPVLNVVLREIARVVTEFEAVCFSTA